MSKLAIFGGAPAISSPLPHYPSVGKAEAEAVARVMQSGCLSGFYGSWGKQFKGGPAVQAFEEAWGEQFGVKHVVSVNSATSGLYAAIGAIGVEPGDEVIVPPYTMSATAMAPLVYGGIPVFADIEPDTYCLSPQSVREAITPRTKAILTVNLFGHPAPLAELLAIAEEHHIKLIEDNAQGPLAAESGKYAGTVGHIGVFSLNYHKHIHTGEGGMCVTNDGELALRLQLIRNHGENVVEDLNIESITNLVGFNYRMTELSAAVGLEQLKKIHHHVERRELTARRLSEGVRGLDGIVAPRVREGCRHVYYVWPFRINEGELGVSRELFSRALTAEGFPNFNGYVRPLYMLPVFQKRIAFGAKGHPFKGSSAGYQQGLCPVAERMWQKELMGFENCMYNLDEEKLELLLAALHKVYEQRNELAQLI